VEETLVSEARVPGALEQSVAKLNSSLSIGLLVISINRQSTVRLCTFLLVEVLPYNGILG
jgi:hypothetical protein